MLRKIYRRIFPRKPHTGYKLRWLADNPDYAAYNIGKYTYGLPLVLWAEQGKVLNIGSYCSIAPGVTILMGGNHRVDWVTSYPFVEFFPEFGPLPSTGWTKGGVTIGNDVWIGQNAMILSGVTIGNGAVIAAGSVVNKDVEPYTIAGGNPAKFIRYRIPEQFIPALEKIAWWNWPFEQVRQALPLLLSGNIAQFVERYSEVNPGREG
ncbi:CatB-related O-acetyltransferase [Phragmitibacter flavus]|uniref:CatB-related O-acetyltransferase n=1 Tax=Phragmitibacter flavus TaxID=2576071 RepID=A0A5R8K7Y5_9BACT|nr:CatB-related O-acetyltransferase [Phragmitibacter flavus]